MLCDPMDVAHRAPLSMGFSRQEYWSGLPCLLQGIFPTQGSNLGLLHYRKILYLLSHQRSLLQVISAFNSMSSLRFGVWKRIFSYEVIEI